MTDRSPSPLVGEGGVRGHTISDPHLDPPPSRGRIILSNFHRFVGDDPPCKIYLRFGASLPTLA